MEEIILCNNLQFFLLTYRRDTGHSDALKGIVGGLAASAVAVG